AEVKVVERVPTGIGNLGYRQRGPNWLVGGLGTIAVLAGAGLYRVLRPGGGDANDPALLARAPVTTATTAASPKSTAPADTTTPPADGVKLVLRYVAASWTVVEADGTAVFRGTPAATDQPRTR